MTQMNQGYIAALPD